MSATNGAILVDRRWSMGIATTTFIAAVVNAGALAAYLLDQSSSLLLAAAQMAILVALLTWLRAILAPSIRSGLRLWVAPLGAATLIGLYLTLATPG